MGDREHWRRMVGDRVHQQTGASNAGSGLAAIGAGPGSGCQDQAHALVERCRDALDWTK
jgi:hypothetical protein